ncbi:MAG TPA: toll/interleukin-1 receptor domain-containing protein [Gemmataceae bacterium]|nr:toll/interleukin-1 receptor domain-containing protein [Gemmataceae bacterium]
MAKRSRGKALEYQVFLSYSHQDRWIAQVMKEKIEAQGMRVWLDAFDLPGGADVNQRILDGLRASAECLVLLSPASRESAWVSHEMGMADGQDKWITLVLLHVGLEDVPDPVRRKAHMSINDFDSYVTQLAGRHRGAVPGT